MSIKLGERKNRTPISAYSSEGMRSMLGSRNTPAKVKQKICNYISINYLKNP